MPREMIKSRELSVENQELELMETGARAPLMRRLNHMDDN
jgi:hypothetical protein